MSDIGSDVWKDLEKLRATGNGTMVLFPFEALHELLLGYAKRAQKAEQESAKVASARENERVMMCAVRDTEREACAVECELWGEANYGAFHEQALAAQSCADRIRRRGQTK